MPRGTAYRASYEEPFVRKFVGSRKSVVEGAPVRNIAEAAILDLHLVGRLTEAAIR